MHDGRFFRVFQTPAFQGLFDLHLRPKPAQRLGQLPTGRRIFETGELPGEIFERRQDFFAQLFKGSGQFGVFRDLNRFLPFCAVPAAGERFIFKPVNFGFVHGGKSGLERGKPIIRRPVERDGAERAAGQFGERVVRNGFAPVEKEGNVDSDETHAPAAGDSRRDCAPARRSRESARRPARI